MTYLGLAVVFTAATLPVLAVAVATRRPDRRWCRPPAEDICRGGSP